MVKLSSPFLLSKVKQNNNKFKKKGHKELVQGNKLRVTVSIGFSMNDFSLNNRQNLIHFIITELLRKCMFIDEFLIFLM